MFPLLIRPESGIRRAALQEWMERHGVDTRMVWTGNATRQPAFRDTPHRVPPGGMPNADRVMEWGVVLPNNHSMTDEDSEWIGECVASFIESEGIRA
jgi:CDP-6-deoxy-D-xylo-4-hexulose-3-dehydrase